MEIRLLLIFLISLSLDRITKYCVVINLNLYESIEITQYLNIVYYLNTGISFGILSGVRYANEILLCCNSIVILCLLVWGWRQTGGILKAALALIASGGVGNVVDRLLYGGVVDFIDLHYQMLHYPAFNVADSAICIGAFMLLLLCGFYEEKL